MSARLGVTFLSLACVVVLGLPARLARGETPAHQVALRHLGARDGLVQSQVRAITQDALGYLWFGTQLGLSRFDSRRFVTFDRNDGLPDDYVSALAADTGGGVWIGTATGQIARWDGRAMSMPFTGAPLPGSRVNALAIDPAGRLWAAYQEGLFACQDGRCEEVAPGPAVSFATTPDGKKLATVARGGLWDLESGQPQEMLLPRADAACIVTVAAWAGDGSLWAACEGDVVLHVHADGTVSDVRRAGASAAALLAAPDGRVWIGSRVGLELIRPDGALDVERLRPTVASDDVRALFRDREDNLWIGTYGDGVYQRSPDAFLVLTPEGGLPSPAACNFVETPDGCVWMATLGAGVVPWCRDHWGEGRIDTSQGLPHDRVSALLLDGTDLWIGTVAGLARASPGGAVATFLGGPEMPIPPVYDLARSPDGTIWVATAKGLHRFQDGTWTAWDTGNGLPADQVVGLAIDPSGNVWAGTFAGGVVGFDGVAFTRWGREEGLPSERVWSVLVDSRKRVWAGTDGGIWVHPLDGGGDLVIRPNQGLAGGHVFFLVEDGGGSVWAGTSRGIVKIGSDGRVQRTLTAIDGLPDSETVQHAAFRDSRGNLWFGTVSGVAVVDPRRLTSNAIPPTVVLERVVVNDKTLAGYPVVSTAFPSQPPALDLGPAEDDIRFEFAALSFRASERVRFRWQLQGYDRDWVESSAEPVAAYRRVPPGSYAFVLTALNSDGVEAPVAIRVSLTIRPPWYATAWFRGLVLLAVAIVGFLVPAMRTLDERRHRKRLEREVTARTRDLGEANRVITEQNRTLEDLSRTDPLTGLGNRRALAESLPDRLGLARRAASVDWPDHCCPRSGLGVFMIDIDHFKEVNDRYGHESGDALLEAVAASLRQALRAEDLLVRWGGEEILVVASGVDRQGITSLAEKLMSSVAATRVVAKGGQEIAATASIGFCPYPLVRHQAMRAERWDALVDLADRLLYLAKTRGRSRACGIVWAPDCPPESDEGALVDRILADPEAPVQGFELVELKLPRA